MKKADKKWLPVVCAGLCCMTSLQAIATSTMPEAPNGPFQPGEIITDSTYKAIQQNASAVLPQAHGAEEHGEHGHQHKKYDEHEHEHSHDGGEHGHQHQHKKYDEHEHSHDGHDHHHDEMMPAKPPMPNAMNRPSNGAMPPPPPMMGQSLHNTGYVMVSASSDYALPANFILPQVYYLYVPVPPQANGAMHYPPFIRGGVPSMPPMLQMDQQPLKLNQSQDD